MKIVDAFWEKRNLGLTAVEITIEKNDNLERVSEELENATSEYIVVKLPVGRVDMSFLLAEKGYVFIEGMNHISHNLGSVVLNEERLKTVAATRITPITKEDLELILKNVRQGLFSTDRIALDPFFSVEKAANRYAGWIMDEVTKGSELFNVEYQQQKCGFIGIKKKKDGYHNFISGIYEGFTGKGLAVSMTYRLIEEIRRRGGKFLSTDISSNNIASLQSRFRCGFVVNETTYVFVKHNPRAKGQFEWF